MSEKNIQWKKIKTWILVVIFFMLLSNFPPIRYVFELFTNENHYKYSNGDGSLTKQEIPFKNSVYNLSPVVPEKYKELYPNSTDTIMYRIFWKNPLEFWRWAEYYYDKRYTLPYKNWEEIKKRRGVNFQRNSNFQNF